MSKVNIRLAFTLPLHATKLTQTLAHTHTHTCDGIRLQLLRVVVALGSSIFILSIFPVVKKYTHAEKKYGILSIMSYHLTLKDNITMFESQGSYTYRKVKILTLFRLFQAQ